MEKKYFAPSELIINEDGSIFHLHLKPENLADKVILVGDPGRVALVASHFEDIECEVESREFRTITGTYHRKRITVVSTGIGCDNIDIVLNELDALANIDFETRTEKDQLRQLTLVRIGTCGGLQPYTPTGTYIASVKSIGFDGLLNFYAGRDKASDLDFEAEFKRQVKWDAQLGNPYVACADEQRHGERCHHSLRRILRSTGKGASVAIARPTSERENREVLLQWATDNELRNGVFCTRRTGYTHGT
mgnify:CR=1 FL=1